MFENLVGNEKVKEYLNSTIENKNISHSFIFVGKPGIGKKQFAHQYAEMIMCLQDGKCDGNSVKFASPHSRKADNFKKKSLCNR